MAISAINSVSFRNNYNNIHFEGKKDKPAQHRSMSSSLKAVPLAVLLAMSPLNNVEAQNNRIVVASGTYENATPPSKLGEVEPCLVQFVSTDGNNSDAELVSLAFETEKGAGSIMVDGKKYWAHYKYTECVDVDTLEICDVTTNYPLIGPKTHKEYYVSGNGSKKRSGYYTDSGEYINADSFYKKGSVKKRISKEFYDYLAGCVEDDAVYKKTKRVDDGSKKIDEYLEENPIGY